MKTLKAKMTVKSTITTSITALFTTLFVWWGMHFPGPLPPSARADDFPINCAIQTSPTPTPISDGTPLPPNTYATPDPYDTSRPELEILPQTYQNPNGASMAWIQYGGVDANHKKPGVIVIHPTGWNAGRAEDVAGKAREIANAGGFFAAAVYYELAPNDNIPEGYIPGQPSHEFDGTDPGWRMKLEVDDIKNYIRAMRADPRCNGWVGVVGGSAGATHAITVALDTNPTPNNAWPHWMQNGDDRPDCAVMLSAIYDFADWAPTTGLHQTDASYVHLGMHNYAQVQNPIEVSTLADLPLNPVNLLPGAAQYSGGFKPIYMFNSYYDHPSAYHQLARIVCLLQTYSNLHLGTDYRYLTIPGSLHSFGYWDYLLSDSHTVGDEVIDFLKAQAGLP